MCSCAPVLLGGGGRGVKGGESQPTLCSRHGYLGHKARSVALDTCRDGNPQLCSAVPAPRSPVGEEFPPHVQPKVPFS